MHHPAPPSFSLFIYLHIISGLHQVNQTADQNLIRLQASQHQIPFSNTKPKPKQYAFILATTTLHVKIALQGNLKAFNPYCIQLTFSRTRHKLLTQLHNTMLLSEQLLSPSLQPINMKEDWMVQVHKEITGNHHQESCNVPTLHYPVRSLGITRLRLSRRYELNPVTTSFTMPMKSSHSVLLPFITYWKPRETKQCQPIFWIWSYSAKKWNEEQHISYLH